MSKMNRLLQQQLNYVSYSQLWDNKTIDADIQYECWKSTVDDVVEDFEKAVVKHIKINSPKVNF